MISKMRSPVRRTMNGPEKIQAIACLGEAFWTWRARLGMVPFAAGVSPTDDRVAKANDRRSVFMSARRLECAAARQLAKLGVVRDQRTEEEQAELLCRDVEETSTSPLQWRH